MKEIGHGIWSPLHNAVLSSVVVQDLNSLYCQNLTCGREWIGGPR